MFTHTSPLLRMRTREEHAIDKCGLFMLASKAKSCSRRTLGIVMGGKSAHEPTWHTGGRCDGGACVEIGTRGESILIRSSADREGGYVTLSRAEWQVFVSRVKEGDFDGL